MPTTRETLAQRQSRLVRERARIAKIDGRLTDEIRDRLNREGKLGDILNRVENGGHASKMFVVRTLDKLSGDAPVFRRGKFDDQIKSMAADGHSGGQIARALGVGTTWLYNRASHLKVRFKMTKCDAGHETGGRRVSWGGTTWCIRCLELEHPGAFRRSVLKSKSEHYEEVRANTVAWLGRQLERASTAFHRADIEKELAKWGVAR